MFAGLHGGGGKGWLSVPLYFLHGSLFSLCKGRALERDRNFGGVRFGAQLKAWLVQFFFVAGLDEQGDGVQEEGNVGGWARVAASADPILSQQQQ